MTVLAERNCIYVFLIPVALFVFVCFVKKGVRWEWIKKEENVTFHVTVFSDAQHYDLTVATYGIAKSM
jgi:hypothetical protein